MKTAKKYVRVAAAVTGALFAFALVFSSCKRDADEDDSGSTTYTGKAFYWGDVEAEDNKPADSSDNSGSGDNSGSDNSGSGDSTTTQDRDSTEEYEWIYFQSDSDFVYGTIKAKVTTSGSTGEVTINEWLTDSANLKVLYCGTYADATTKNETIKTINLFRQKKDSAWIAPTDGKVYDLSEYGLLTTGTSVANRDFEFSIKKKNLVIKETVDKTSYQEWTTYTWYPLDVADGMKVTDTFGEDKLANLTFVGNSFISSGADLEYTFGATGTSYTRTYNSNNPATGLCVATVSGSDVNVSLTYPYDVTFKLVADAKPSQLTKYTTGTLTVLYAYSATARATQNYVLYKKADYDEAIKAGEDFDSLTTAVKYDASNGTLTSSTASSSNTDTTTGDGSSDWFETDGSYTIPDDE